MGKKKLSLKPVQRGFATTSISSKKVEKAPEDDKQPTDESVSQESGQHLPTRDIVKGHQLDGKNGDDWEGEKSAEQVKLQDIVDRLHDKAGKEVSRILKAIDFDKRLALSFPKLEINLTVRDRVLQLALEEQQTTVATFVPGSNPNESDRTLIRMFIAHQVLGKLGFKQQRILQSLRQGVTEGGGWEEALEWLWLNLTEDECLAQGDFAVSEAILTQPDEPLLHSLLETPPENAVVPTKKASKVAVLPTIAFQSQDDSSGSEDEPDLNKVNDQWASLMLHMHKLTSDQGGKGVRKGKANVIMETREIRALKQKIAMVEKEYMFSRKDALISFNALKKQYEVTALESRLRGGEGGPTEQLLPDILSTSISENGDEDGIFGGLLDEPSGSPDEANKNTTVNVVSMPIPKQNAFGGSVPKVLLRTLLEKSAKQAVITYALLSGASRAVRVGLEISWSSQRRRVWRMEDIACGDMVEAENYVSTLALAELTASGDVVGVNWKSMPVAYRDLWEKLEREQQAADDEDKRRIWSEIIQIVGEKTVESGATNGKTITTTTNLEPVIDHRPLRNNSIKEDFAKRVATPAYQQMRKQRDTLPIATYREEIISTLERTQVMVLSGETGCGKSTQLPSFILEENLREGKACKIFVTEPRRISAISLAQRVSQELGDAPGAMGTPASQVGYSIRLESKVSPSTRLAFVTNGIALRMLEGNALDEVTHIVVDEVHERSIESDFLLIVLKSLLQERKDLKVILMSATLDAEKISTFFGGCPCLAVPGRTFPVRVNYLEDAVELAEWSVDESSPYAVRRYAKGAGKDLELHDESEDEDPTRLSAAKYSEKTVSTVNLLDTRQIPYDLIIRLLEKMCFDTPELRNFSAATLVFMPGLAEIRKLNDLLCSHPAFSSQDFVVYPLHSSISSEGQSAVFDVPSPGIRKIVIATNIAETGITIPDITCVIDSGKHREMRYDEKRQLSRLVETYIAKSNAKQRRGRAGRVREGLAYHLFTKARHDTKLAEHPVPEMLRLSLQDLALRIKILKVNIGSSVEEVLSRALDPPSSINIQRALSALVEVKALTPGEEITPLGRLLSKLPMDVHLGKFLLVAALFKCLDPALTIAATLNSKSPFVTPFGLEQAADVAKRGFAEGDSDFLTVVKVFDSWRRASDDPAFVRTFCRRNFVSQQNLQQIEELRQQLLGCLVDSEFVAVSAEERAAISRPSRRTKFLTVPRNLDENGGDEHVLGAALAAGLYPKLLIIDAGVLKTVTNQQPVAIHPSSINFKTPKSNFGANYLTYFTLMHSKKLYAWEVGPVDDRAVALACGDQAEVKVAAGSFLIDRRVRYQTQPKSALAMKRLRAELGGIMATRLRGKNLTARQERWFQMGIECLKTGLWDTEAPSVGVV